MNSKVGQTGVPLHCDESARIAEYRPLLHDDKIANRAELLIIKSETLNMNPALTWATYADASPHTAHHDSVAEIAIAI
jgi:hypothetical protein